jgi:hypothetical protein
MSPNVTVSEGPEAAILRIATGWEARYAEKGLRSSPSPIASFDRQLVSRLELVAGQATTTERLSFEERFMLRDGSAVQCSGSLDAELGVAYERRAGEPTLTLTWPALERPRECNAPSVPPVFERPAGQGRFVLRSDQLVGVEPARERRTFLPVD